MDQDETDKAYARGRENASKSGDRMGHASQVLLGITTGMTAHLTGLRQVRYQPPAEAAGKAAYDRGWRDHFQQ